MMMWTHGGQPGHRILRLTLSECGHTRKQLALALALALSALSLALALSALTLALALSALTLALVLALTLGLVLALTLALTLRALTLALALAQQAATLVLGWSPPCSQSSITLV